MSSAHVCVGSTAWTNVCPPDRHIIVRGQMADWKEAPFGVDRDDGSCVRASLFLASILPALLSFFRLG
ncbi:hypothetical protein CBOM_07578 [Ceraceosorus bombacis]|uniref:Uncharacterized protein n=1 Tax=Ceraceosorus bombacis TaxID=401625 RepID=A0A0P1BGZ0_9BASI|nr:hypothetical protein CBOM_07578 [Ceraceosorus bombacis]